MSPEDLYDAITPSHLLIGRRLLSIPNNLCHSDNDDEEFEVNRSILTRRMKYIDHTLTQFWNRWRTETCWSYVKLIVMELVVDIG
uniref:DUF5641 domain-containing protein n=1 Tax=Amphimedon queenslandica TaxID=400682 RepID=A0A1X7TCB8_AMPQE